MALPIDPKEFARVTGFSLVEDRGVPGEVDEADHFVPDGARADSPPVPWEKLETARLAATNKLVMKPAVRTLMELGELRESSSGQQRFGGYEARVRNLIAKLERLMAVDEFPRQTRGKIALLLGGLQGMCLELGESATKQDKITAFNNLKAAHEIDPDNARAWGLYGVQVLALSHAPWWMRAAATSRFGLNIKIDVEIRATIDALKQTADTPEGAGGLFVILSHQEARRRATAADKALLRKVEQRLEIVAVEDPAAHDKLTDYIGKLEIMLDAAVATIGSTDKRKHEDTDPDSEA